MPSAKPIRIGILGAARIAPLALVRPATKVPGAQVVAIAARDPQRAEAFARKHGIPRVHQNYDALLADPEIDLVYNPLPNSLHGVWSIRALEAGKHVLCEKPMAANAAEAERMVLAAARTGRVLVEAFHYRYHPLAARLKQLVESGELGAVRHVEAHLCFLLPRPGDIRYRFDLGGGATMDTGCYAVNLVRYLAGAEPEVVGAQVKLASPEVDRWMCAELRFADGRTGRVTCGLFSTAVARASARVVGERGELRVLNPYLPHVFHWLRLRSSRRSLLEWVRGEATYTSQLRAVVQAIRSGSGLPTEAGDAVANMRVIDAIYTRAGLRPRPSPLDA